MPQTLFTSRTGGVSSPPFDSFNLAGHVGDDSNSVHANRKIFASKIGLSLDRIYFMNQVHGREVATIDASSISATEPTADALFTTLKGRALVVLVADCTPLLLKSEKAVAAVHIGRRGMVLDVLGATLKLFDVAGISRNEITGELGPSICKDCYEVDAKTYEEVVSEVPASATKKEKRCLDITAGIEAGLRSAGIAFKTSGICVRHSPGYFSYRREGQTGRQAGVVWL